MPKPSGKIEVMVTGAVKNGGRHMLSGPGTIPLALDLAGGLAPVTPTLWPAKIVSVRRKKNSRMAAYCKFDMTDGSGDWKQFKLLNGDMVIFQWHVLMK